MSRQAKATKSRSNEAGSTQEIRAEGEAKLRVAVQHVRKYAATRTMQLAVSCVMNGYTLNALTCH